MFSIQIEKLPGGGHVVKFKNSYKLHYVTSYDGEDTLYI